MLCATATIFYDTITYKSNLSLVSINSHTQPPSLFHIFRIFMQKTTDKTNLVKRFWNCAHRTAHGQQSHAIGTKIWYHGG